MMRHLCLDVSNQVMVCLCFVSDFFVFDFQAKCWFKCDVDPKELGCHTDIGPLTVLPGNRAIFIFGGADQHGTTIPRWTHA